MNRIFQKVKQSEFDSQGMNRSWKIGFTVDERSKLKKFVQDSGLQFKDIEDFKLEEMCQKLIAQEYSPNSVLCYSMERPSGLWFVLSGNLIVLESNGQKSVVLNYIEEGQSCGDPEMNLTVSLQSLLQVSDFKALKCFFLPYVQYEKILCVRYNQIWNNRQMELQTNFEVLQGWDYNQLRSFAQEVKERVLRKDEVLFRDGTTASYFYFLLRGKVSVEKVVNVKSANYWPKGKM